MTLHRIVPGLWCVPAAIYAITGADPESVIQPALNRADRRYGALLATVTGASMNHARAVLEELGWNVRPFRADAPSGKLRARVSTWAKRTLRWPGSAVLIATSGHCMVVADGRVHDNWAPLGAPGERHPWATAIVTYAALVERRRDRS